MSAPFSPTAPRPSDREHASDEADASQPRFDLSRLRESKLKDYAIRFLFGGAISVLAALIGHWITPRFGGVFTAFPAILLASLTLIGKHTGDEPSAEDAQGAAAGGLALVVMAIFIALTITRIPGAAALFAALGVWLIVAVAIYAAGVKIGWLRTVKREEEQDRTRPQEGGGEPEGGRPRLIRTVASGRGRACPFGWVVDAPRPSMLSCARSDGRSAPNRVRMTEHPPTSG